jgi:hypothetical protein
MTSDDHGPGASPINSAVLQAIEPYLDAVADRLWARFQRGQEKMIDQAHSDLGPRKHRDAVKRRLANNEGGAGISPNGRRFLLTPEALREELAGKRKAKGPPDGAPDGSGAKSRTRALADFEKDVIGGLRAVRDNGR